MFATVDGFYFGQGERGSFSLLSSFRAVSRGLSLIHIIVQWLSRIENFINFVKSILIYRVKYFMYNKWSSPFPGKGVISWFVFPRMQSLHGQGLDIRKGQFDCFVLFSHGS